MKKLLSIICLIVAAVFATAFVFCNKPFNKKRPSEILSESLLLFFRIYSLGNSTFSIFSSIRAVDY